MLSFAGDIYIGQLNQYILPQPLLSLAAIHQSWPQVTGTVKSGHRQFHVVSKVDAPDKCELNNVISFLLAEYCSLAEIHQKMIKKYRENFRYHGGVQEQCRKFKEIIINIHEEGTKQCKSVTTTEGIVQQVDQKGKGLLLTISELPERISTHFKVCFVHNRAKPRILEALFPLVSKNVERR